MRHIVLLFSVLALIACAAPAPTPTPTPAPVFVTSVDQIVGIWEMSGAEPGFIRFNADGSFDMHENEAGLDDASVKGTIRFDGDKATFEDNQLPGVGIYRLEVTEGGSAEPTAFRARKVQDDAFERVEGFTKTMFRRKS